MSDEVLAGHDLQYASAATQKVVKRALPIRWAIRELCALMHNKHPGMHASQMAETLAKMGFNYYTADATARAWRKEQGMKP